MSSPRERGTSAYDAIIVAVGIVAVLVANVAYVGYLTVPGGEDPYWQDCYYLVFVVYTYMNGFSLVFAVAAIFAVTFGPTLLIWKSKNALQDVQWRNKVVKVGLVHLAFSLLAFVAAFACAGFVTALVDSPPANCGLLTCDQGGVPCSTAPVRAQNTSWPLDPQLAALNKAAFWPGGSASQAETPTVMCANYKDISGRHNSDQVRVVSAPGAQMLVNDSSQGQDKSPCLFLNPTDYGSGFVRPADHGPATWCSAASSQGLDSPVGAALKLNGFQAYNIVRLLGYQEEGLEGHFSNKLQLAGNFSSFEALFSDWYNQSNARIQEVGSKGGFCFSNEDWDRIPGMSRLLRPDSDGWTSLLHKEGKDFDPALSALTFKRAGFNASSWTYSFENLYQVPQMRLYIEILGGLGDSYSVVPVCQVTSGGAGTSAVRSCTALPLFPGWEPPFPNVPFAFADANSHSEEYKGYRELLHYVPTVGGKAVDFTKGPLSTVATNYATLRYTCSGGDHPQQPVLCDKGDLFSPIDPPLAVDATGLYLTRKDIIEHSGQDISVSLTTTELERGVIAMLVVAVCANIFTILFLAHEHIQPAVCKLCRSLSQVRDLQQPRVQNMTGQK